MKKIKITFMIFYLLAMQSYAYAQNPSDYLILQGIGNYSNSGKGKCGNGAGIIGAADHFDEDHNDITCRTGYYYMQIDLAVSIKVERHAGADSDRWLLHEVEDSYRDEDLETLGVLTDGAVLRRIDSKRIFWIGIGGGSFMWVSNNLVIKVSYTDLQGTKPEPLEVVQAYLQKFPSTITLTDAEIKSRAHNETWIKDEMERRLWLCDKWNAQFQLGKVTQADMLKQLTDHMTVFLKYRQRYYGIEATDDINALFDYSRNKDAAAIMNKLTAYKAWWAANKGNAISL